MNMCQLDSSTASIKATCTEVVTTFLSSKDLKAGTFRGRAISTGREMKHSIEGSSPRAVVTNSSPSQKKYPVIAKSQRDSSASRSPVRSARASNPSLRSSSPSKGPTSSPPSSVQHSSPSRRPSSSVVSNRSPSPRSRRSRQTSSPARRSPSPQRRSLRAMSNGQTTNSLSPVKKSSRTRPSTQVIVVDATPASVTSNSKSLRKSSSMPVPLGLTGCYAPTTSPLRTSQLPSPSTTTKKKNKGGNESKQTTQENTKRSSYLSNILNGSIRTIDDKDLFRSENSLAETMGTSASSSVIRTPRSEGHRKQRKLQQHVTSESLDYSCPDLSSDVSTTTYQSSARKTSKMNPRATSLPDNLDNVEHDKRLNVIATNPSEQGLLKLKGPKRCNKPLMRDVLEEDRASVDNLDTFFDKFRSHEKSKDGKAQWESKSTSHMKSASTTSTSPTRQRPSFGPSQRLASLRTTLQKSSSTLLPNTMKQTTFTGRREASPTGRKEACQKLHSKRGKFAFKELDDEK